MNEIIDPRSVDRPNSYIGKSVPRPNARSWSRAGANTSTTWCCRAWLHVAFVRSPHAHAKIVTIDGARP